MNFTKKIGTSFTRSDVEQMKGIEPSYSAWEADVLPLNYARKTSLNIWDFSIISPKLGKVNVPGKFFRTGRICQKSEYSSQ